MFISLIGYITRVPPIQGQTIPIPTVNIFLPNIMDQPTPTPQVQPTATPVPTPTATPIFAPSRRIGTWIERMRVNIKTIAERPDTQPEGEFVYLLKDLFTTRDGSWDTTIKYGSIDLWARNDYLRVEFDDAGADHHLFGAIVDAQGNLIKETMPSIQYWSDGFDKLGDPNYTGYVYQLRKAQSGWSNNVMFGSSYVPERGESGPWCWTVLGVPADVVCGGGMPANQHISTFAVWQKLPKSSLANPLVNQSESERK